MRYYILSLSIPARYYERYRTYIDRYRTCRHTNSKDRGDVVYIQISFRPIVDNKFVEMILQNIDEICCGDIEVLSFSKSEPYEFAFSEV